MSEKEIIKKKPAKYDDAETKKAGSPIETPYTHRDSRSKKSKDKDLTASNSDTTIKLNSDEVKVVKANE